MKTLCDDNGDDNGDDDDAILASTTLIVRIPDKCKQISNQIGLRNFFNDSPRVVFVVTEYNCLIRQHIDGMMSDIVTTFSLDNKFE